MTCCKKPCFPSMIILVRICWKGLLFLPNTLPPQFKNTFPLLCCPEQTYLLWLTQQLSMTWSSQQEPLHRLLSWPNWFLMACLQHSGARSRGEVAVLSQIIVWIGLKITTSHPPTLPSAKLRTTFSNPPRWIPDRYLNLGFQGLFTISPSLTTSLQQLKKFHNSSWNMIHHNTMQPALPQFPFKLPFPN